MHLGNCDIGCDVSARNTLDLNYLAVAEQHGAEVRPLHIVAPHRADGAGYRVIFNRIANGALVPGHASRRASSSSRPDRWDRPSCCSAAATDAARLPEISAAARRRLEQQRRFPDAGDSSVRGRQTLARADHYRGDRSARRRVPTARTSSSRTAGCRTSPTAILRRLRRAARAPTSANARSSRACACCSRPTRSTERHAVVRAEPRRRRRRLSLNDGTLILTWDIAESKKTIDAVVETAPGTGAARPAGCR